MKLRKGSLRLLCLLLTVCILASMLPQVVFAATVASGTCGTKVNWTLDDAGTLTITGSGDMDNWGAGYAPWYSGYRDEIKSVVIGNGVTSIGNHAFYYCLNLSGVTISNTVTTINYNAFYQTALKTLEIPDSVTTLGANAFCYCNSLTSVSLGKGVATIGGSAFYQCTNLMEFSVDNDNPNYSSDSFGVLFNKDKTKLIQAPCGINGSYAIPDSVTSIEEAAFAYADLSSLSIGNNVSTIGKMAFWQCAYMTDVTISDSVTSIGSSAFYGCTGLTDVYYKGTQEQWSNISISGSNTPLTNATIYFNPANSGEGGSESESETELVDPSLYPESEHVYGNNLSEEKVFTYPGAEKLIITFSDETEVENKYDKIYLYDCSGNLVKEYTGTEAAGQSVIITGDTFTIKLTSDVSVQKYGYSFSSIIAYMPTITIDPSLYPESKHNYDSNLNETQTFTYPGAKDLTITFSASTEVENSYDKLYLYDGADNLIQQYTGTQAAGQTVTILGDTFKIRLTSDGSVTKYGYSFSSIVARMSGNVKTVTGIEIKALPTKTQYSKGETLDTTGLVLTAIYSDGTTADITDGYTVTGFDSTTAGDKNLKVSYKNCTASFFVSVTLSGSCGTNLSWVLDSEGTLTISGSGNMTNWSGSNTPWYSSRDTIKKVIINDGVYSIGNYAFYNCTNLEEIVMPDFSIDSIGNYAFYNCTSLLTVEMDNGISTVGTGAFYNCTNLSKVVFSYNTYSIGANCFKNCSGLEQVFFTAEPPTFGSTPFVGVVADIYYTEDCGWTDTDRQNYGGTLTWIPAEMGVTSAGKCGNLHWQYSTYLCQLKITGSGAMHSHTSASCCWSDIAADVQKVEIGEGITSIGDYAFYNCTDLWSVTIPDGVTSIGNSAFRGTGVGRVLLPDSCTSIGYYAFSDCTDLFYINLPDSITSIGHHAFSGCGDLESITIPEKITQIPSSAFAGTGLTSVSIPSGVTSIASGAFDACNGLRYILFEGNKPSFSSAFNAVNATVYYPADNSTWTITGSDLLDACGTLTFVAAENNIVASGTYYYGYGQWSVDLFGNLTFDGCVCQLESA